MSSPGKATRGDRARPGGTKCIRSDFSGYLRRLPAARRPGGSPHDLGAVGLNARHASPAGG